MCPSCEGCENAGIISFCYSFGHACAALSFWGELSLQQAVELHQHLWSLRLLLLTLWLLPDSPAHAAWQCQAVVFLAMSRTLL